jgi:outer membrane immunogenic protein
MSRQSIVWFAACAFALCAAETAAAADLPAAGPVYKAPPAAAPYDWTGFYIGANAGYGWADPRDTIAGDVDSGAGSGFVNSVFHLDSIANNTFSLSNKTEGALGGGQIGFNWQPSPRWLTGIETDFQFSAVKGGSSAAGQPPVLLTLSNSQSLDWFGTLRARFGYLLTDRFLVYGTAGLAYGETQVNSAIRSAGIGFTSVGGPTSLTCLAGTVCLAGAQSQLSAGWTAGGGVEYAVWKNVTFKLEYLHVDLGSQNLTLTVQPPTTGNGFAVAHFDNAFDLVRGGANVRF